ncbi:MAG: cytochrome c oxidase assembly protein [Parvibaculaceae bacterium]|nr:cytochrome c oxidase assembly protein [Parvibaculaceae bacterium]
MTDSGDSIRLRRQRRNTRRAALACAFVIAGMGGMSYAAVPLYRIFCQMTGYGGTTQVSYIAPEQVSGRRMTVRFDANVSKDLPWGFEPVQKSVEVVVGKPTLVFYRAVNRSDREIVGQASFNVAPEQMGYYFDKMECFCFTEQRLKPGQSIEMPVTFFIDPGIEQDEMLDKIHTVTLSYTFYEKAGGPSSAALSGPVRLAETRTDAPVETGASVAED